MSQIKLMMFDMGNVLLSFDPNHIFKALCPTYKDKQHLISIFNSSYWFDLDAGIIDQEEALNHLKKAFKFSDHHCIETLFAQWHYHMTEIVGMRQLIDHLKQKGHRIVLASNASDRYHVYIKRYSILEEMDHLYYSCDLKSMKPSLEFFKSILSEENLKGKQCYFIDDKLENCEAAQSLGIHSFHFNNNISTLNKTLKKEGIL